MYRILSFNLLCAGKEQRTWQKRAPKVISIIREANPDSFGVQEAHWEWMETLSQNLPEYSYVGVGREDGKKDGEFSAVFYKKDKFTASESGNFWISETPEKPSKGWDSACTRIATFVKLTDKENGKEYIHFNTHLDHVGRIAQINGARMIQEKAASFGGLPVVCTGDFNVFQDSDCYNTMVSGNMKDARKLAPDSDECYTFHGFRPDEIHERIDFVFVDEATVKPVSFKVINKMVDGDFYSDHNAIYADVEI
ncbi:MAG: endonuclease/exonuclease/phosphatase family protein [Clostridia bacterium]|nr:endonuclease/exonuclease/phosphatase family protein [Clostridia bacterium]